MTFDLTITTADEIEAERQDSLRAAVTAEAQRRITLGATFAIDGTGDIPVRGGMTDQINLIALAETARDLIAANDTTTTLPYRDAANTIHQLTPTQMLQLVRAGKSRVSAIYAASWALKDGASVPEDYADDSNWP